MKTEFIAHRRKKDGESQNLNSHLLNVSELTSQFTSKIGLKDTGRLIGLLHDLGKASNEFNNYIKSATGLINPDEDNYIDAKKQKGKVDHSSAGAQIIYRSFSDKVKDGLCAAQILSLAIASHHSGLIDCLAPDGLDNYHRRMEKDEAYTHTTESLNNLDIAERSILNELLSDDHIVKELLSKLKSIQETNDSQETRMFKFGLMARFLFSCLIDADRLDTAEFELWRVQVMEDSHSTLG
jgi:CRISPR-associated endonuclease/helicase Cas3